MTDSTMSQLRQPCAGALVAQLQELLMRFWHLQQSWTTNIHTRLMALFKKIHEYHVPIQLLGHQPFHIESTSLLVDSKHPSDQHLG